MIDSITSALESIAGLAEANPLGLLVSVLFGRMVWAEVQLWQSRREVRSLSRTVFRHAAENDLTLDEDTTRIIKRRDPRRRRRGAES